MDLLKNGINHTINNNCECFQLIWYSLSFNISAKRDRKRVAKNTRVHLNFILYKGQPLKTSNMMLFKDNINEMLPCNLSFPMKTVLNITSSISIL